MGTCCVLGTVREAGIAAGNAETKIPALVRSTSQ